MTLVCKKCRIIYSGTPAYKGSALKDWKPACIMCGKKLRNVRFKLKMPKAFKDKAKIDRIKMGERSEIVAQRVTYKEKEDIDIREYISTPRYTGFTKKGFRIPTEKWNEFVHLVNSV